MELGTWSQNRHPQPFSAFPQGRLNEQSGVLVRCWDHFDFSLGSHFGELRMMLYMMRLEVYRCLNVTEVGIVAWSRRTDVASGKEVTVPRPKDEKFHGLIRD
jgi:hypothetical protein